MTNQRTEVHGLVIRREARGGYDGVIYTDAYKGLMKVIGQCIKRGGTVTMATYVDPVGSDTIRCDATLDWSKT